MAKARALDKRRKSIRNIRKITRTMELIATARFKKAMDRATAADGLHAADHRAGRRPGQRRPGGRAIRCWKPRDEIKNAIAAGAHGQPRPVRRLQRQRAPRRPGRDSTSCKASVPHAAAGSLRQARHRGLQVPQASRRRRPTRTSKTSRRSTKSKSLANRYLEALHHRQARPARRGLHEVRQRQPADGRRRDAAAAGRRWQAPTPANGKPRPSRSTSSCRRPRASWKRSCPTSFKVKLFKCFLDAAVSEQIARMVAMKAATENAGEMIKHLSHAHTTAPARRRSPSELMEIIGGVEALKSK